MFPEFVYDVVWNHAQCSIKDEVERKYDYTPRPLPPSMYSSHLLHLRSPRTRNDAARCVIERCY
jgi:hypothetical protein